MCEIQLSADLTTGALCNEQKLNELSIAVTFKSFRYV